MNPKTPQALLRGHKILFNDLGDIVSLGGDIGENAKLLADIARPHFKKEEEYALPPLSLLSALSEGNWEIESQAAVEMAERLHVKLLEMKNEHGTIRKILKKLNDIAENINNEKVKQFTNDLELHIEVEEQVLYPATIFVGEYLKKQKI